MMFIGRKIQTKAQRTVLRNLLAYLSLSIFLYWKIEAGMYRLNTALQAQMQYVQAEQ